MEINPFAATLSGINLYNDRLPDVSPAAQQRVLEARKRFKRRLEAIDLSSATASDKLSAEILAFILEHDIALAAFNTSFAYYFTFASATEVTTLLCISYLTSKHNIPRFISYP